MLARHWVQLLQVGPVQHMVVHWAGGVLLSTQLWKQPISPAQVKSLRQFSVSMQQLLTMHWLQGVPPGSREQLPASTGLPQWPPLQVKGAQHCDATLPLEPSGRQLPSPQMLLLHSMLQHSEGWLQAKPSSVHWLPLEQMLLSQV